MAAMTSCVDHEIGRVVDALKTNGMYDNAIIAVVADNGGPPYVANSNWPMRGGKVRTVCRRGNVFCCRSISWGTSSIFIYPSLSHTLSYH